jgi:hypothetical protein
VWGEESVTVVAQKPFIQEEFSKLDEPRDASEKIKESRAD